MHELNGRDAMLDKTIDNLNEKLVEFLTGNGADFEMVEALDE